MNVPTAEIYGKLAENIEASGANGDIELDASLAVIGDGVTQLVDLSPYSTSLANSTRDSVSIDVFVDRRAIA